MGRTCAHICCKNSDRRKEVGVRFYAFPGDAVRFGKWLQASGLSAPRGNKMVLCSKHFLGEAGPTAVDPDPIPFVEVADITSSARPGTLPFLSPRIRGVRKRKLMRAYKAVEVPEETVTADDEWETFSIIEERGVEVTTHKSFVNADGKFQIEVPVEVPALTANKRRKQLSPASKRARGEPHILDDMGCEPLFEDLDINMEASALACEAGECTDAVRTSASQSNHDLGEKMYGAWSVENKMANINEDPKGNKNIGQPINLSIHQREPWKARRSLDLTIEGMQDSEAATTSTPRTRDQGLQCDMPLISYERCKHLSCKKFKFFTGIKPEVFELIFEFIGGYDVCSKLKYFYHGSTPKQPVSSLLSCKDRFFLTLIRLRRGTPLKDLGFMFGMSEGQASRIFYTWIRFLSISFQKLQKIMFLSAQDQRRNVPKCFRKFKNLRAVIDCFEIRIQKPWNFEQQGNTYSSYKSSNTLKILIAISLYGSISFLSECYEGSISDRQIVIQSGFLEELQSGDAIMADRGFNIEPECNDMNVDLIMPPFLGRRSQLTARETATSRAIAKSRVHVERAILKLRNFRLLRYFVPNTMIPVISDIAFVVCMLINFDEPYFA